MGYLQLAENNGFNHLAENTLEHYLVLPPGTIGNAETMRVREDYFDNMPDAEFAILMTKIAPYQIESQLSEFDFDAALNSINKGQEIIGKASGILNTAGGSKVPIGQKFLNVVDTAAPALNAVIPGLGTAVKGLAKAEKVVFGKIANKRAERRAAKGKPPGLFSKAFGTDLPKAMPLLPAVPPMPPGQALMIPQQSLPAFKKPVFKKLINNAANPNNKKWGATLDINGTTITAGGGEPAKKNWFKEHTTEVVLGSALILGAAYMYSQKNS